MVRCTSAQCSRSVPTESFGESFGSPPLLFTTSTSSVPFTSMRTAVPSAYLFALLMIWGIKILVVQRLTQWGWHALGARGNTEKRSLWGEWGLDQDLRFCLP